MKLCDLCASGVNTKNGGSIMKNAQVYTPIPERALLLKESSGPISGEELFQLGDIGPSELIEGELVFLTPTGYPHGIIEGNFTRFLGDFIQKKRLGVVLSGEVGIYTKHKPDTVRGADVAYISKERLKQATSTSYLDVAPELIVEVLSPNDRWPAVTKKLEEYFAIGVLSVWIADPERQEVFVYHSPDDRQCFTTDDILRDDTVLPGFETAMSELFSAGFE